MLGLKLNNVSKRGVQITKKPMKPHDHSSWLFLHIYYNDVIMNTMASSITSLTIVYATVYSDADQRKHQSSPVTADFPVQMASNAENVSIWWRHHVMSVLEWCSGAKCVQWICSCTEWQILQRLLMPAGPPVERATISFRIRSTKYHNLPYRGLE